MLLPDIANVFPARYPLPVFIEKHPRFYQSLSAPPEALSPITPKWPPDFAPVSLAPPPLPGRTAFEGTASLP